jgi:AcrR family transcriptional regulator
MTDAVREPRGASRARRRAPPEERRAQILEAALQCFASKGYHSATMDDLVRASGLSKGSLYWHFQSKEEVLLALFDAFAAEIFAAWEAAAEDDHDSLELLRREGEIAIEKLCSEMRLLRAWAEFLTHPAARERLAAVYVETRAKLGTWVRRGIARGEIRQVPVDSATASLVAAVEGLLLQAMVDPDFDARRHWEVIFDVQRRGLAA